MVLAGLERLVGNGDGTYMRSVCRESRVCDCTSDAF